MRDSALATFASCEATQLIWTRPIETLDGEEFARDDDPCDGDCWLL